MNPEDPEVIKANVAKLVAAGAPEQDIHDYIEAAGHPLQAAPHLPTKLAIAKRNASMPHPEDMEDEEPSYAQKALGGIASLAKDIPGAEAAQAGARALVRGQPYREALSDIRGAEDAAPKWVRRFNRVAGGMVAGAAMPGSAIGQGAAFGGFSGLLKADPDAGIKNRLGSAAVGAAIGAVAPKVAQGIGTVGRSMVAKSLGKSALAQRATVKAAGTVNYARAAREGNISAANPMPQVVGDAMDEADIRPYIAEVRNSRTMQGANPAAIVREAYKLMTERQKLLSKQIINSGDFKAGSELERTDITAGKRRLLDATQNIMPSFRPAVTEHAKAEAVNDAFEEGADVTRRIISGNSGAAKNLAEKSPDAFIESIPEMTPEEAQAALAGLLGRVKETRTMSVNPLTIAGIPKTLLKFGSVLPYQAALDKQAGNKFSSLLAAGGIGATAPLTH